MSQTAAASRFVYQLTIRPVGRDTTPEGADREFHDADVLAFGRNHGSVSYAEPLTVEQISHYSLIPVTQMAALNGRRFEEAWLGRAEHAPITHRVRLSDNQMGLQIDSDCEGNKHSECLSYPAFVTRSKRWVPLTVCPWCDHAAPIQCFQEEDADWLVCPSCGGN